MPDIFKKKDTQEERREKFIQMCTYENDLEGFSQLHSIIEKS